MNHRARHPKRPVRQAHAPDTNLRGKRLVVGHHAIREVFTVRPKAIEQLWLRPKWEDSQSLTELHEAARGRHVRVEIKPLTLLDRLAASHQGACVVVSETPKWTPQQLEAAGPQMVLVLDGIEDPQNLGAILRTAWLMGIKAIFVPQNRASSLTPSAMKAASGGAEHVPLEMVGSLPQLLSEFKKHGYWVYGLAESGKQTLWNLKLPEKIVWVIGSEDKGLRSTVSASCDELVRIPQISGGSSYNASVSAAIVMAEGARQHL